MISIIFNLLRLLQLFTLVQADVSQQPIRFTSDHDQIYNIAIIGAGAAGSSTAYYLSKFANESPSSLKLNITVFEQNGYIGGRTTTVNALDDPRYPVELGASIFVKLNQILYNATRDFGLPTADKICEPTGAKYDLGIWDGEEFVFTTASDDDSVGGWKGRWNGWLDIAKLLWKYGLAPVRFQRLQKSVIGRFLTMYEEPIFPFDLTQGAEKADLLGVTGQTGGELLDGASISEQFQREIVQASTRVNYAQNLNQIHGLETLVSMSAEGAMAVQGGNWQIFQHMLERWGATVKLNTTVVDVTVLGTGRVDVYAVSTDEQETTTPATFDTVIIAAPSFNNKVGIEPKTTVASYNTTEYVPLHVTLFTSPYRPSLAYFTSGRSQSDSDVPDSVLTTLPDFLAPGDLERGEESVGSTGFWSLSTLRTLSPSTDGFDVPIYLKEGHIPAGNLALKGKQYLYKIFSPAPLDAADLVTILGLEHKHPFAADPTFDMRKYVGASINTLPKEAVSWSYEKLWYSYPYLPPKTEFGCFDLYHCRDAPVPNGVDKGRVWTTSVMEEFISTMETSALAGKNVARLLVEQLSQEHQTRKKSIGKTTNH
ncbi:hypothetical protein LTR66_014131 [Elasticomyces elasticus]|nr:hypothetical protein LTR66_014131 [Elasticomyces elasticus]